MGDCWGNPVTASFVYDNDVVLVSIPGRPSPSNMTNTSGDQKSSIAKALIKFKFSFSDNMPYRGFHNLWVEKIHFRKAPFKLKFETNQF